MSTFTGSVTESQARKIVELNFKIEELETEIVRRIIENTRLQHKARLLWEQNQTLKGLDYSKDEDSPFPKR